MAARLRDHRPLGGRQGHADPHAASSRCPSWSCRVSATTRAPRPGEDDGVDYHFLSDEEFDERVRAGDFVEHAAYSGRRYGTLRSRARARARARACPVVLEIEVQGARQVARVDARGGADLHRPAVGGGAARAAVGRGTTTPEQVEARLRTAREELAAQDEFHHVVVNDRLERRGGRARGSSRSRCRGLTPQACASTATRGRFPLGATLISPRVDRLLEHVDSNYASVIVAAKRARQINSYYHNLGEGTFEEFPPPMVDTGSKNYLTIALEEVAARQGQVPLPPEPRGTPRHGAHPARRHAAGSRPTRRSSSRGWP